MELEFVQRWDDARLAFGNGANLSPTVRDYLNAMHHYKVHEMKILGYRSHGIKE